MWGWALLFRPAQRCSKRMPTHQASIPPGGALSQCRRSGPLREALGSTVGLRQHWGSVVSSAGRRRKGRGGPLTSYRPIPCARWPLVTGHLGLGAGLVAVALCPTCVLGCQQELCLALVCPTPPPIVAVRASPTSPSPRCCRLSNGNTDPSLPARPEE